MGEEEKLDSKSEIVGLNNLKNGVDISYNWGAICLFWLCWWWGDFSLGHTTFEMLARHLKSNGE